MTNRKEPGELTARQALEQYGFTKRNNEYVREDEDTQSWEPAPGGSGWHRYDSPTAGGLVVGSPAWGREMEDGRVQVPYAQTERYQGVSGLHPSTHPEAFEWVWPDAVVQETYAYGYESIVHGRRYRKDDDGRVMQDRTNPSGDEQPEATTRGNS